MASAARSGTVFVAGMFLVAGLAAAARAQSPQYPKPTELPNPYRLVEGWPTLPEGMNGGHFGEVIRVHVHSDGNIWVFHRCFNTVPPGGATCVGRSEPPILEFDPSGKLLQDGRRREWYRYLRSADRCGGRGKWRHFCFRRP
jgi:hypothetical protein